MNFLRKILSRTKFYKPLRTAYRLVRGVRQHPLQRTRTKPGIRLKRLGTEYGGWFFVDEDYLQGCTILSAGLGEDASFDIEFVRTYSARVVLVDPTPRAIAHYAEISARFGRENTTGYVDKGRQPAEAYDLRGVTEENLTLIPKALWIAKTKLRFFLPKNPEHVSHSIVNYQNDYANDTAYIEVDAERATDVISRLGLSGKDIPLVKLDIEGAETEVIEDFLSEGLRPKQILVEFDELNVPSKKGFSRIDRVHANLVDAGYECVWTDGQADFLYLLVGPA